MVTLREVAGDPEEAAALQRVMESDEGFALRTTGHPPGPADALGLLVDRARQGQGIGAAACRALEREVRARWPWARRLRLSVVRRCWGSGGGWGSPRPARSAPGATTSSSPRRS